MFTELVGIVNSYPESDKKNTRIAKDVFEQCSVYLKNGRFCSKMKSEVAKTFGKEQAIEVIAKHISDVDVSDFKK